MYDLAKKSRGQIPCETRTPGYLEVCGIRLRDRSGILSPFL